MFLIPGWTMVSEVYRETRGTLDFWHAREEFPFETSEETENSAITGSWDCIGKALKVGVVSITGDVIAISNPYNRFDIYSRRGRVFDLEYGTIGSGFADYGMRNSPMGIDEARLRYGPFLYCPVVIDSYSYAGWFERFEHQVRIDAGYPKSDTEVELSGSIDLPKQIVSMFQSGELVRRDDLKRRLAPDMKHEEWKLHWSIAVDLLPEISKPGPRSTKF